MHLYRSDLLALLCHKSMPIMLGAVSIGLNASANGMRRKRPLPDDLAVSGGVAAASQVVDASAGLDERDASEDESGWAWVVASSLFSF